MSTELTDLSAQLRALVEGVEPVSSSEILEGTTRRGPSERTWSRFVVAALLLLVVGAIGLTLLLDRAGPSGTTTKWRAARPLPSSFHVSRSGSSWQLVGEISRQGWQLHTPGPRLHDLVCPTATTCYADGGRATNSKANSIYVSDDGGASWEALSLPSGFLLTSPLSCPGAATCAAGGALRGRSVLITSIDGGHQWTVVRSSSKDDLVSLACFSSTSCDAVFAPASLAGTLTSVGPGRQVNEWFEETTDGGHSWRMHRFPTDDEISSLACPRAGHCIVLGYAVNEPRGRGPSSFVRSTVDAGSQWEAGMLPPRFALPLSLSCGDASHCLGIGLVNGSGGSMVIATSDGGHTWQRRSLPSELRRPFIDTVSCASASTCWITGQEAVPQGSRTVSSVILETTDSGATWTKASIEVPASAAKSDTDLAVIEISCPKPSACVGLGVSPPSTRTPVYAFSTDPAAT